MLTRDLLEVANLPVLKLAVDRNRRYKRDNFDSFHIEYGKFCNRLKRRDRIGRNPVT